MNIKKQKIESLGLPEKVITTINAITLSYQMGLNFNVNPPGNVTVIFASTSANDEIYYDLNEKGEDKKYEIIQKDSEKLKSKFNLDVLNLEKFNGKNILSLEKLFAHEEGGLMMKIETSNDLLIGAFKHEYKDGLHIYKESEWISCRQIGNEIIEKMEEKQ